MNRNERINGERRPSEEYLLFALMFLLLLACAAFSMLVALAGATDLSAVMAAPEPAVAAVRATRSTSRLGSEAPTPVATWTPTATPQSFVAAGAPPLVATALPSPSPTATATQTRLPAGTYRVQAGDSLLGIAYRAGLTLDEIMASNPSIVDPNRLSIGQVLRIPEGGKVPVGPPSRAVVPAILNVKGSNISYPQTGSPGGYVPPGAMSVSAARTVNKKYYPAGTFEYLHGQLRIPFPLPNVSKAQVKLPPAPAADLCPLTGTPLTTPAALQRRPLNARIDNSPPARPQSGLGEADMIFESLAEGGVTRFTAVFLCSNVDADIGPIRSARLIDLQLAPMLKAILVHVGASAPVLDMIWSSEVGEADFDPVFRASPAFGRISSRPVPHNMYSSIGALWQVAKARGLTGPVDLQGLSFSAQVPPGGNKATSISIPYHYSASNVGYEYENGLYVKTIGGEPHTDMTTGRALRFANVIILYAQTTASEAYEDGVSSRSLYYNVQGAGRAILVRDGFAIPVVWHHEGRNIPFHYTDEDGNHIPLKPGKTMVNIVPLELGVTIR